MLRVRTDESGPHLRRLVSRLKTLEPDLVLLEAGLELPIVAALARTGSRECSQGNYNGSGLLCALCGTQRVSCSASLADTSSAEKNRSTAST